MNFYDNQLNNKIAKRLPYDRWLKNREVISGADAVKQATTKYLPDDNAYDPSPQKRTMYNNYLARANFLPLAKTTVLSLIGAVFRKPAQEEIPESMRYLLEDADGMGQGLEQIGKMACKEIITTGRIGFLADYPRIDTVLTLEESQAYKAYIAIYPAECILDWQFRKIRDFWQLSYVKLQEQDENGNICYRELILDDENDYFQRYYLSDDGVTEYYPRDANGNYFKFIPFSICGTEENSFKIQEAIIDGLVDLNIAHYQVSADQYSNLHIHAGSTLVVAGNYSVEEWNEFTKAGITVGDNSGIFVGNGGNATLLQLPASSAHFEKLKHIEEQAVLIGARLIDKGVANQTAEAARIKASASISTLGLIVGNLSEALEQVIEYCAMFMQVNPEEVLFKLNDSFYDEKPEAQVLQLLKDYHDAGIMSIVNIRDYLRKTGLIGTDVTDELIDAQILGWKQSDLYKSLNPNIDNNTNNVQSPNDSVAPIDKVE